MVAAATLGRLRRRRTRSPCREAASPRRRSYSSGIPGTTTGSDIFLRWHCPRVRRPRRRLGGSGCHRPTNSKRETWSADELFTMAMAIVSAWVQVVHPTATCVIQAGSYCDPSLRSRRARVRCLPGLVNRIVIPRWLRSLPPRKRAVRSACMCTTTSRQRPEGFREHRREVVTDKGFGPLG